MSKVLSALLGKQAGASSIEYGLIAALIGLVIITAVAQLGADLTGTYAHVGAGLN